MKICNANRKWLAGTLAVLVVGSSAGVLRAQPDGANAPMGNNPPEAGGRGGRGQGGRGGQGGNRPDFRNMTPEQREQMRQQMQQQQQQRRAENLRRTLANAGFTSTTLQDAVIAFDSEQDKAEDASQEKVRQLRQAIRDGASDNDIAALLAAVRADEAAAKQRRETALRALDAQIGYTKQPKLDAVLALAGITGEEFGAGGGGRGGFGGGFGGGGFGGRGGRGGQGGPGGAPAPAANAFGA